jgi:acyl-CoA reductase-like NAD-dependent aldehyde dehydrogenase
VLELGGNAGVIVDADADLEDAVARLVVGAFYQSGQSCIKAQRILVHERVYADVRDRFVAAVRGAARGRSVGRGDVPRTPDHGGRRRAARGLDPLGGRARRTSPVRRRPEGRDARGDRPRGRAGGRADRVPRGVRSRRGPRPFRDFDEAIDRINDSVFGLQAGVFTRDLYKAQRAWDRLAVGAVLIGEVPSWRVDHMPYGGIKDSGLGREGLRFAIEDMTEIRLLVIRTP